MPTSSFKLACLAPLLALAACMGGGQAGLSPAYAPSYAPPPPPVPTSDGAIFQASRGYAALTSGASAQTEPGIATAAAVATNRPTAITFSHCARSSVR